MRRPLAGIAAGTVVLVAAVVALRRHQGVAEVAPFRAERDRLRGLLVPPKPPIVAADHE